MNYKVYIPLLAACFLGTAAKAQITAENTYQGYGYLIRMSNGDYKYQMIQAANNQVTLYSLNHSIYKRFTVPLLAGGYNPVNSIYYVSDALFDTNPSTVEYAAVYSPTNTNSNLPYKVVIYSETGSQLALLDSTSSIQINNTPAGTKMLAYKAVYNPTTFAVIREYTRVYSLGGQLPLRVATPTISDVSGAYPNPAGKVVNLPYSMPSGQTGMLRVYDISGRLVKSYQIDTHIDHLEMSTQDLRAGVYSYTIESSAGLTAGRKFVIQ